MPPTHTDEGFRAAEAIREEHGTKVGILVLSQYVETTFALRLVADGAGGVGYLLKDRVDDLEDFSDAIRRIARGGSVPARRLRCARVRAEDRGRHPEGLRLVRLEPGILQLLAVCMLFGALALAYDLQFGFTGLLSFGHALYIALGVYVANIAITIWGWSFAEAVGFTLVLALALSLVLGFVSLRVTGIAFAMVAPRSPRSTLC